MQRALSRVMLLAEDATSNDVFSRLVGARYRKLLGQFSQCTLVRVQVKQQQYDGLETLITVELE